MKIRHGTPRKVFRRNIDAKEELGPKYRIWEITMNSRVSPAGGKNHSGTRVKGEEGRPGRVAKLETENAVGNPDILSDVKQVAKSATDTLKHQASELGADVGHELNKTASAQKEKGAEALRAFAGAINAAAEQLTAQSPAMAHRVRETADKIEALSDNIAGKDVSELLKSAADLAREQPALFVGGAVAVGFGVTRFLMAHPRQRTASDLSDRRGSKNNGG